jgi:hypothetical protein
MKYTISFDFPAKVTSCHDCPLLIRRQRDFATPIPQGGTLSFVERTVIAVAICAVTNEEINMAKKVGSQWDKCPLVITEGQ